MFACWAEGIKLTDFNELNKLHTRLRTTIPLTPHPLAPQEEVTLAEWAGTWVMDNPWPRRMALEGMVALVACALRTKAIAQLRNRCAHT